MDKGAVFIPVPANHHRLVASKTVFKRYGKLLRKKDSDKLSAFHIIYSKCTICFYWTALLFKTVFDFDINEFGHYHSQL